MKKHLSLLRKVRGYDMEKVIVSACLLGEPCRYDAKSCPNEEVLEYLKDKQVFAVCPEVLGGLTTPRSSCEIVCGEVISKEGIHRTQEYIKGAKEVLALANSNHIDTAILKSKSPSCGYGEIYDGSFSFKLVKGNGICAEMLVNNGIKVINSDKIAFKSKNDNKKSL